MLDERELYSLLESHNPFFTDSPHKKQPCNFFPSINSREQSQDTHLGAPMLRGSIFFNTLPAELRAKAEVAEMQNAMANTTRIRFIIVYCSCLYPLSKREQLLCVSVPINRVVSPLHGFACVVILPSPQQQIQHFSRKRDSHCVLRWME